MTLDLAADAYVLGATEGEALWFADALVTYNATGTEFEEFTRTCGWPATAMTMPSAALPGRPSALLHAAVARHGIDIVPDPAAPRTQGDSP